MHNFSPVQPRLMQHLVQCLNKKLTISGSLCSSFEKIKQSADEEQQPLAAFLSTHNFLRATRTDHKSLVFIFLHKTEKYNK